MADASMFRPASADAGARFRLAAAGAAAMLMVLAPALWNGFPLLFPDTGGYLARPIEGTLELGRSALYGAFLAAGVPLDFWPNVVVQAALVVWLIALTLRSHGFGGPLPLLVVVAALCLATGMPWYAATLIPDILLPAAILALHLLAFRTAQLRRSERAALIAVIAVAIASHMGTLAVCAAVALALAALSRIRRFAALPRPRLAVAGIAVAAGIALAPLSNFAVVGQFAFTPGGESFLFGRLVQDGMITRYLEDRCPDPEIRLCAYRDKVPETADEWLWGPGNPLGDLGGWRGYAEESRRIILDTLWLYPLQHLQDAVATTLTQLALLRTEVSLTQAWMEPMVEAMQRWVPQLMPQILAARQQAAPFADLLAAFNLLHVPVAALALIGTAVLPWLARRRALPPELAALALVVLLSVLVNAAVCGVFSNPVARYQSRLIWLAPLTMMIAGLGIRRAAMMAADQASGVRICSARRPTPST